MLDHFSRAVIATAVLDKEATAADIVALLDRAVPSTGRAPRHIVSDRGSRFRSDYRHWCTRNAVKPRFGAIGKHGSIAVLERMIRTLKDEGLCKIFVPFTLPSMQAELDAFVLWYNTARPHSALGGATPAERLTGEFLLVTGCASSRARAFGSRAAIRRRDWFGARAGQSKRSSGASAAAFICPSSSSCAKRPERSTETLLSCGA